MNIITSKIDRAYSVAVYPKSQYGNGNGYYFFYTCDGAKSAAIVPSDIPKAVLAELRPEAKRVWGSTSTQMHIAADVKHPDNMTRKDKLQYISALKRTDYNAAVIWWLTHAGRISKKAFQEA